MRVRGSLQSQVVKSKFLIYNSSLFYEDLPKQKNKSKKVEEED